MSKQDMAAEGGLYGESFSVPWNFMIFCYANDF